MTKYSQGAYLVEVATTVGNASLIILQSGLEAIYSVLLALTLCLTAVFARVQINVKTALMATSYF